MGYIRVPKLGSSDEPIIDVREMPQEWQYYKALAEDNTDQCYLFYKGASATFSFIGLSGNAYVTLYGGLDGMQPLYRCYWATVAANRYWAKYINGQWVRNTTQPSGFTYCQFRFADLDNYKEPFLITFNNLQGKPITNDEHLGTTELFTVVIHPASQSVAGSPKLMDDYAQGGTTTNSRLTYSLVAYYGPTAGLKGSDTIRTPELEFIEFNSIGNSTSIYFARDSYWLGKIVIPNNVETMGERSFYNNRSLQEAVLPQNLITIPSQMFDDCTNLKKVTLGDKIETIKNNAFEATKNLKKITLPNTVETISQYAFSESGIEKINFPSSLTTIEQYAFSNTKIKEAILPDTLQTLGNYAFDNCSSLETVHLPNTLTTINASLFNACEVLANINIPSTLTSIGNNAFYSCYKLKNVALPSTMTSIGNYGFYRCFSLNEMVVPNGCSIGDFAFGFCDNLKKITLPNDLDGISNSAFVQCKSLEEIELPNTILSIGSSAFAYCSTIKYFVIPSSVINILASAFSGTGACRYIKMLGDAPTLANVNAIATTNTYIKIFVPYEYISNYQTATNWSSTSNSIKKRQRGYKTFNQGDTLPSTDSTGNYTLTWYDDFNAILNTTATGTPSATPVTTASHDGEYYCIIS